MRWVDGEFGAVGADRPGAVSGGWSYEESSNLYDHMTVSRIVYGCRPSTFTHPETSTEADFEVAQLVVHDAEEQDPETPGVDVTFFMEIEAVFGLSNDFHVESPYVVVPNYLDLTQFPDLTPDSDLQQLLRELGFTPRCTPEE